MGAFDRDEHDRRVCSRFLLQPRLARDPRRGSSAIGTRTARPMRSVGNSPLLAMAYALVRENPEPLAPRRSR